MKHPRWLGPNRPAIFSNRSRWQPWTMLLLAPWAAGLVFFATPALSQIATASRSLQEQNTPVRAEGVNKDSVQNN